ncbi:hypothetical protein SAMN05444336_103131 [Albimonas donghaensis]|uniref:Invasion protein IalB, involved in pathogenesis n=1 Tax=Albimonas donghaensis TaxID=356660 RepID=A0A1H2YHX2_9RHOB|nr:hypothetical protein [Albimonas donghaensis]SDX04575.1 hypothetical protein SAMN05444336_103131 [Albimonas donghaensis]
MNALALSLVARRGRRTGALIAALAVGLGLGPALAPAPAGAAAPDLPPAMAQGWSVHRYMGGGLAQVRARDGGWFAVRCQGGARNGEIAYSRPGRDGGEDGRLRVEFSFDDGRAQVSQDLGWDNVERHWSARLSPAEPMAGWMRDSGVMRVTAEDRPGSDFTLRGASEALSRMYEICG